MRPTPLLALLAFATPALAAFAEPAAAADGAAVFQTNCAVCHSVDAGTNKLGPSLFGVVGRKSASVDSFTYSPAMTKAGLTWDAATLDKYLTDPQALVPGTKMILLGIKSADDRKALIDFLAAQN